MTNKLTQFTTHSSQFTNFAVLDYSGTHSLNAHTNCISNFNIRNRLSALTSFARQSLASLLSQNNSLNCFVRQSRKSAFTLAETLIVMGIIGVVAALTLPNLNSSTGNKEKVVKVKKIYQNLNDAYGRATAVYGPYGEWSSNSQWGRLTEFMRLSKDCNSSNIDSCFKRNSTINSYNNSSVYNISGAGVYAGIMADGTSIALQNDIIFVDIDGSNKGQNISSIDIFGFKLTNNEGVIPFGQGQFDFEGLGGNLHTCNCGTGHRDLECTEWVVLFDNMDYIKCPDQLNGTTNITCK